MTLVYKEHLVDLGEHGLLAMSTEFGFYLPLPANEFGYAHWYRPDATQPSGWSRQGHNVLNLCSRGVDQDLLVQRIDAAAKRFEKAVPSVRGSVEWTRQHLSEHFGEAPTGAYALSGARVLLIYGGMIPPHAFRVINLAHQRVDFELTVNQLCEQLGIWHEPSFSVFNSNAPVVYAASEDFLCIYLGQKCVVLQVTRTGFEVVPQAIPRGAFDVALMANCWVTNDREGAPLQIGRLSSNPPPPCAEFSTPLLRAGHWSPRASAYRADRFALSHPGGQLEVVDIGVSLEDRRVRSLRPLKKCAPKDALRAEFSPNGRYLLVEGEYGSKLVDLERMRMADVLVPRDYGEFDRMQFDPTVRYRMTSAVANQGGLWLHNQQLQYTALDSLAWEDLMESKPQRGKATLWTWIQDKVGLASATTETVIDGANAPTANRLDSLIGSWTRPALRLERRASQDLTSALAKKIADHPVRSQLFGAPCLPAGVAWPQHAGQPMLLLAQLVLQEAALKGLPTDWPQIGALLFFVGLNSEGEVAVDESFNPVATKVLWLSELGDAPSGEAVVKAALIEFVVDPSSLPQVDAVIVEAADLDDFELRRYTEIVENALPDGPLDGDRIGGYPHILQSNDVEADGFHKLRQRVPEERDLPELAGWRLLMQLASDDACMWGADSGIVYFMISEADLKARDFSGVVVVCQGA